MKSLKVFYLVLLLTILLTAASACKKYSGYGVVTDKIYYKAYEYTYFMPIKIGDTLIYMPFEQTEPAQYKVIIETDEGKKKINVSKELFQRLSVGDTVTVKNGKIQKVGEPDD
jgi:hypothetical protein